MFVNVSLIYCYFNVTAFKTLKTVKGYFISHCKLTNQIKYLLAYKMKLMCLWSGPEPWLAHFKPRDDTTESQMYVVLCQLSQ